MNGFDYFYGMEAEQYSFFRVPKILFQAEQFKSLSCEAKILYGILLDRMGLSMKNGWLDEEKRVYIIFTIEEAMNTFSVSKPTAVKIFAELDSVSGIGLIERKRKGFNLPSRIYVKNFNRNLKKTDVDCKEVHVEEEPEENLRLKNLTSDTAEEVCEVKKLNLGGKEILPHEVKKFNPNKTNNNTYSSDTHTQSIYHTHSDTGLDGIGREELKAKIHKNIDYTALCSSLDSSLIDELVEIMLETIMTRKQEIRISGEIYDSGFVKSRLLKINMSHIQYVLDSLENNRTQIRNIKAYLLTALFNAPVTINNYYQAKVQHGMAEFAVEEETTPSVPEEKAEPERELSQLERALITKSWGVKNDFCKELESQK